MAMHHHPVCRVNGEPRHVAHHVGGKLGGEFASVLVAPQQLRGGAVGCNADDAQIGLRVLFHILKIFAGAGDDEDSPNEGFCIKAGGDGADDPGQVQILLHFRFVQQVADISAVALVPAKTVHIGGGFHQFLYKRCSQNVFHMLFLLYCRC